MENAGGLPIDTRGKGGYFIAPPSLHKSGQRYEWIDPPETTPVEEAPPWLLAWIRSAKGSRRKQGKAAETLGSNGRTQSHTSITSPPSAPVGGNGKLILTVQPDSNSGTRERAIAYLRRCDPAISGQGGHAQSLTVARGVCWGFDLGEEVGFELLRDHYNPTCQPSWSEGELRHKAHEADTVPFGKPRGWLLGEEGQEVGRSASSPSASGSGDPTVESVPATAIDDDIEALPLPLPPPWPTLQEEALYGPAGEVVRTIAPETESDRERDRSQALLSCRG